MIENTLYMTTEQITTIVNTDDNTVLYNNLLIPVI